MIKVDLAEIELLTDLLVKMASDTEESLNKLRQISNEMYNDIELPAYPQTPVALEAVSVAIESLNRGNDTLQSLRNAILPVVSKYQENEKRCSDALMRMTATMDAASVGFNAAVSSTGIIPVEHTDGIVSQEKVQQLVSDSVQEMQITNIAAVSKAVKEEYEVSNVVDLVDNS